MLGDFTVIRTGISGKSRMVRPAFLIGVPANLEKLQLLPDSFPVEVEKTVCVISTEHHWFCKRGFEPPWLRQECPEAVGVDLKLSCGKWCYLGQCPSQCAHQQSRECWW